MPCWEQMTIRGRESGGRMLQDLITVHLLESFAQPACPLCCCRSQFEREYLYWLLAEHATDPVVHIQLQESIGFCRSHARQLVAWELSANVASDERGLATALLHETLVAQLATQLPELQPHAACPECRLVARRMATHMEWFRQNMGDARFQERYRSSHGLCRSHLVEMLAGIDAVLLVSMPEQADRRKGDGEMVPGTTGCILPESAYKALEQEGCPVCRARVQAVVKFRQQLEQRLADGFAEDVVEAGGFCQEHTGYLEQDAAGRAVLKPVYERVRLRYRGELAQLLATVAETTQGRGFRWWPFGRRRPVVVWRQEQACPLCGYLDAVERDAVGQISEAAAAQTCLPHLRQVLPLLPDARVRRAVTGRHIERLGQVHAELGAFIRHFDYRYHDEPVGREQSAWLRAIRYCAGFDEISLEGALRRVGGRNGGEI